MLVCLYVIVLYMYMYIVYDPFHDSEVGEYWASIMR